MGHRETTETITKLVLFCDRCGGTKHFSYGSGGKCPACGRDVCGLCSTADPDDPSDRPMLWCDECWNIGEPFREQIEAEMNRAYDACNEIRARWYAVCKREEADTVSGGTNEGLKP